MPSMRPATKEEMHDRKHDQAELQSKKREFSISPEQLLERIRVLNPDASEASEDITDGLPGWQSLNRFLIEDYPNIPDVVIGLVRVKEKVILGAPPKGKKSFGAIDLTVSVTHGLKWLGKYQCTEGPVLYINLEGTERGTQSRFRDTYRAKGVVGLNKSAIWNLRGKGFEETDDEGNTKKHTLDIEKLADAIISRTIPGRFCLIVIDPIYKVFGDRNENAAGDIATFMSRVDRIAEHTGAAIFMTHHFAKGNAGKKVMIDKTAGSNVFSRDPDVIINLSPKMIGKRFTYNHFDVEVIAKDRSDEDSKDFCLSFCYPLLEVDEFSVSNGGNSQVAMKPNEVAELVQGDKPVHIDEIVRGAKLNKKVVQNAIAEAVKLGLITEAVIRDGGRQRRTGYCTDPQIEDIEEMVLDSIPAEGIAVKPLRGTLWDNYCFYGPEVDKAVEDLKFQKAIERKKGKEFRGIRIFKVSKVVLAA